MGHLKLLIQERLKEKKERIIENKKKGGKVVAYVTNHIPTELFEAAGVDYLGWDRFVTFYGAPKEYIDKNVPHIYFPNDWCVYSLANFVLEVNEPKPALDLVVVAYPCDPVTKMWEYIEKDYEVFYFNLPRVVNDNAVDYWCETTRLLKKKLEEMTGREITEEKLKEVIERENIIRNKLAELRKAVFFKENSPVKASELLELLYARSCLRQLEFLDLIEKAEEIMRPMPETNEDNRPAFYVMGPLFAEPAPKVLWKNIVNGADMLEKLENMGYKLMEENWMNYMIGNPYDFSNGKSMLRLVGERSYLQPKHPSISPNTEVFENHREMCRLFELAGALFFNYKGCRVYLIESQQAESMFDAEDKAYKHIQLSGKTLDLPEVLDAAESFIISNS